MGFRWGRTGAIAGLLLAILGDLGRRAWWAYRSGGVQPHTPRAALIARRPTERSAHVPLITPAWQPLVARALPVHATAVALCPEHEQRPVVWLNATSRPDVADLPRVLNQTVQGSEPPVLATQWLADLASQRVVLVVTLVEPVVCSWAISFDLHRDLAVLELIAATGWLAVALGQQPAAAPNRLPLVELENIRLHMQLPIASTEQLRAILAEHAGSTS